MSALTVIQTCAKRLQVTPPVSGVVTSTDANVILLVTMVEQACQDLVSEYAWPELQKEYSFTLATNEPAYALPLDYERGMTEVLWNTTQRWPLMGPLTAREWQTYKSGLVTTMPRQRFRVKYWGTKQFFIDPTPTSSENGQIIVYEYITKSCIIPKTWIASTSWLDAQYCSYNGNIYDRGGTGAATTGTTPPTHTSGTVSDGSINWTFTNAAFETILLDSDLITLDNKIVVDRACWRFKQERGLDFEADMQLAEEQKELSKVRLQGSSVLTVNSLRSNSWMIGPWSYPEGNY